MYLYVNIFLKKKLILFWKNKFQKRNFGYLKNKTKESRLYLVSIGFKFKHFKRI